MDISQSPGIIARVKTTGTKYNDLLSEAEQVFNSFFSPNGYRIIGAEIQPGEISEGLGPSQVISWSGIFYAMPNDKVSQAYAEAVPDE